MVLLCLRTRACFPGGSGSRSHSVIQWYQAWAWISSKVLASHLLSHVGYSVFRGRQTARVEERGLSAESPCGIRADTAADGFLAEHQHVAATHRPAAGRAELLPCGAADPPLSIVIGRMEVCVSRCQRAGPIAARKQIRRRTGIFCRFHRGRVLERNDYLPNADHHAVGSLRSLSAHVFPTVISTSIRTSG